MFGKFADTEGSSPGMSKGDRRAFEMGETFHHEPIRRGSDAKAPFTVGNADPYQIASALKAHNLSKMNRTGLNFQKRPNQRFADHSDVFVAGQSAFNKHSNPITPKRQNQSLCQNLTNAKTSAHTSKRQLQSQ